ncbi:MAG: alpha/beta hydrolase [Azospirillaceae bacterium]|nr:alpha/beta hydrolase [Azospirillaceae bacterium]
MAIIKRGFVDTSFGQLHYRTAGQGPAVILHHMSPGSAKQLESLIALLADGYRVVAFDTPGNGDSTPLPLAEPTIADLAAGLLEGITALGITQAAVYGSHTGADVAIEVAIAAPQVITKVILDGIAVFTPEQTAEYLNVYARPFAPELDGTHLLRCFMYCRDQSLFYPWYKRDLAHKLDSSLYSPQALQDMVLEVLKAAETYPVSYRAAFTYDPTIRMPLVTQPVLVVASMQDGLLEGTIEAAKNINAPFRGLPGFSTPEFKPKLAEEIRAFVG